MLQDLVREQLTGKSMAFVRTQVLGGIKNKRGQVEEDLSDALTPDLRSAVESR